MTQHSHLLDRARELLAGGETDVLLAAAATRIGTEAFLRVAAAPLVIRQPSTPSLALYASILRNRGLLTSIERNACKRLGKLTSRAIHTAAVHLADAERFHDFAVELLKRLERRAAIAWQESDLFVPRAPGSRGLATAPTERRLSPVNTSRKGVTT